MPASQKQHAEQSLSDLAIAEVGAKLPKLMSHLVGFETVECNDELTRAAGILAFELGSGLVYSPVLFLNGRIKAATDILYLADADVFTSATPAWVEYLSSRGAGVTGKPGRPSAGAGIAPTEALRIFNRPPMVNGTGKSAAASVASTEGWGSRSKFAAALPCAFKDLFAWWCRPDAIASPASSDVSKLASAGTTVPGVPTVNAALRSLGPTGYRLLIGQWTREFPELLEKYAELHGGPESLIDLYVDFTDDEIAADRAKHAAPLDKTASLSLPTLSFVDHATLDQYPEAFATMDVHQKQAVLETGLAVLDKRAKHEKAQVFVDDYVGRFTTPTESGFHEIFNDQGELAPVYVGLNPFFLSEPGKKLPAPIIIDAKKEDGAADFFFPKDGEAILCRSRLPLEDEGFAKKFDKLTKLEDASVTKDDDRYVAVSPTGVVSAPFEIKNVSRNQDGLTTLAVHTDDDMESRLLVPPKGDEGKGPDDVTYVRIVERPLDKENIRSVGAMVYVPSAYRVMKVKVLAKDNFDGRIRPGSISQMGHRMGSGLGMKTIDAKKEASGSGSKFILRQARANQKKADAGGTSRPLDKAAALKTLIGSLGFDEADARSLLDDSSALGTARRWYIPPAAASVSKTASKTAQLLSDTPFPVHDETSDTDEYGRPVKQPTYGAQEIAQDRMPVAPPEDAPDAPGRDPAADALGAGFQRTDQSGADLVMRAAAGGEEVFDAGMLSQILRTNRVIPQIDEWLVDLSGALDKLCRNLLLMYYKQADVAAAYGSDRMAELEDTLLQGIKIMGEIVLFYKQRASESSAGKVDALDGN